MTKMSIFLFKLFKIIRNPKSVFLLIFFPIIGSLTFGYFFEKGQREIVIPIALVDKDKTEFSTLVTSRLSAQQEIQLHKISASTAERMLARKEVDSVYIITEGFQENLLKENRENNIEVWVTPSSFAEGIVREVIASEVTRITSNIKAANRVVKLFERMDIPTHSVDNLWSEAYIFTDEQWSPKPLMTVDYEQWGVEGDRKNTFSGSNYTPFIRLWTFFVMLSCFLTSDWIIYEKQKVFTRMSSTYRGVYSYLLQCSGAYLVFHIFQIIISSTIFQKLGFVNMNLDELGTMIFFVVFCLSVSIGVASFIPSLGSYYIISFLTVMIIGILGGSFFPTQDLSSVLASITSYLPQSLLFREGNKSELGIYFGFIIVLWILAVRRLQIKR